ncbi:hypothetical protein N7G274_010738 [Stereocaulon virgatum]|uniref:Uncharacterized protein n=1 Tax=Stereocaulon virgatum TaxID=373712 RepID=A0ABR3ZTR1_9LECA
MQPYLVATLFTGVQSKNCGPWADLETKTELDRLMRQMWKDTMRKLDLRDKVDADIDNAPSPIEARMMFDKIAGTRTQFMEKIRSTVKNHYMFGTLGDSIADCYESRTCD